MSENSPAIEVRDLVKVYDSLRAVNGISFTVQKGQVFGLLGPNGAGKSTTIEMIEGLRRPDGGAIRLLDIDVVRTPQKVKERIGVQLQSVAFYRRLSPRRILRLFGSFYHQHKPLPPEELISMVDLEEKADTPSESLSGGQQQRLAIAVALVNDPEVIFLDEPTTGLDPQARRSLWRVINELKQRGKTIVLTTHYLEEAEHLCDCIIVVDHGRIIASGTPAELIAKYFESAKIEFLNEPLLHPELLSNFSGVDSVEQKISQTVLLTADVMTTAKQLIEYAQKSGVKLKGFSIHNARLEDVFLKLTGKGIRE